MWCKRLSQVDATPIQSPTILNSRRFFYHRMKTFVQFTEDITQRRLELTTEVYDKDVMGSSQIRRTGEGGRVGADRRKTEPERRRMKGLAVVKWFRQHHIRTAKILEHKDKKAHANNNQHRQEVVLLMHRKQQQKKREEKQHWQEQQQESLAVR